MKLVEDDRCTVIEVPRDLQRLDLAGVVSLGVAVMVWTGLAMSWRRFFGSAGRT